MTKLLVSVRDAAEAEDAVAAGAHLIDVKEPRAGSLGAAPLEVIEDVIRTVAGRRPVSAAFGELIDFETRMSGTGQRSRPVQESSSHLEGLQFAKIGLAGCHNRRDWSTDWNRVAASLPECAALVAVVYADWQEAEAPPPHEVIAVGSRIGCRAMLIDTFNKQGPGLLGLWSLNDLRRTISTARDAKMLTVVGGQITEHDLPVLLLLAPDYIAVRGAICSGSRTAQLDPDRVREFIRALSCLE